MPLYTYVKPKLRGTRYSAKVGSRTIFYTSTGVHEDKAKMLLTSYMHGPWAADGVHPIGYPIRDDGPFSYWWVDCQKVTNA